MFSQLFSGFQKGLTRSLDAGLSKAERDLAERQSLIDLAEDSRLRRRLAVRSTRRLRKTREAEDRAALARLRSRAAGSGLRLKASSKAGFILGQTRQRADKTAQATSVLSEALSDRLARAALRRQAQVFGR